MKRLKISLAHISPLLGGVAHNRHLVEKAVAIAAESGSDWLVTPELSICGYEFMYHIGTTWISPQPDKWMTDLCSTIAETKMTVFLSYPERDAETNKLYNTLFVIDKDNGITGRHRKVRVLSGCEGWSSPGETISSVVANDLKVGMLICADAYTNDISSKLLADGAQILLSAAAWGPGPHGPNGEWEQRTIETGLPMIVCNRTGDENIVAFNGAESLFIKDGQKLLRFHSSDSTLLTFDLETTTMTPSAVYETIPL